MNSSSPTLETYDVLVLGSGEGGKFVAWNLARAGKRVALVEREWIGGSCPNIACLPSKNVIHSAKVVSYARRGQEFGLTPNEEKVDLGAVRARKRAMVDGLIRLHLDNFKASGAELIMGSGRFIGEKTLEVTLNDGGTRRLRGEKIVLSTGSRAALPTIPGLIEAKPLTHIGALELAHVPEHLIILGGGFIALEFAQAMRRFGSRVTIIDRHGRLAPREDEDVALGLAELCDAEGITRLLNAEVTRVSGISGQAIEVWIDQGGQELRIEGTDLLVAAGRTPNTAEIGLEVLGVERTASGHIRVNERLETTAPDIYAVGDCAGSPQFTHIAFDDHRIVRDNILGQPRVTTGRLVPFCLFTDPELARIGLSETEAKERGVAYRLAKIPMSAALRTLTLGETRGFMKALIDRESDRILGFTVFGVDGGEIMGAVQIAMIGGLPYTALRDAILTHPTLLEGLVALFSRVPPRAEEAKSP